MTVYWGLRSGIEVIVHAMNDLSAQHSDSVPGYSVLLVDATNAFNSLNHSALVWNAHVLWPHCSHFLLILIGVGHSSLFFVLLNICTAKSVLHRVTRYQCFCML